MEETRVRHLARIAAAAAAGRRDVLAGYFREALASVPRADLQEAALQVFLFAGYPRGIGAFEALAEAAPGGQPATEPPADFVQRGEQVFAAVYGPHAAEVKRKLSALHPDFARFVLKDAYGQVLGRPFLGLPEREAMAVAMLAALDQEAQLRAHVKGALRVGLPAPLVRAALAAAEEGCGREL
ncbi:MAG: carboxymuconolactone decarboxylase family protein, partial [Planctomycetes bacterium]|nr:carboxymuconolactone decarboxylase family protein [Planctomycetota bacterium]